MIGLFRVLEQKTGKYTKKQFESQIDRKNKRTDTEQELKGWQTEECSAGL